MLANFIVKDSGERMQFDSGMVRDTAAGKIDYWRGFVGPMFKRLCIHVTKGAVKYPDVTPGVPNWTLANGAEELQRYRESAARHFVQWFDGDQDEDHAAAVLFNINGAEYVKQKMAAPMTATEIIERGLEVDEQVAKILKPFEDDVQDRLIAAGLQQTTVLKPELKPEQW
jgi:hypothetical protein